MSLDVGQLGPRSRVDQTRHSRPQNWCRKRCHSRDEQLSGPRMVARRPQHPGPGYRSGWPCRRAPNRHRYRDDLPAVQYVGMVKIRTTFAGPIGCPTAECSTPTAPNACCWRATSLPVARDIVLDWGKEDITVVADVIGSGYRLAPDRRTLAYTATRREGDVVTRSIWVRFESALDCHVSSSELRSQS